MMREKKPDPRIVVCPRGHKITTRLPKGKKIQCHICVKNGKVQSRFYG